MTDNSTQSPEDNPSGITEEEEAAKELEKARIALVNAAMQTTLHPKLILITWVITGGLYIVLLGIAAVTWWFEINLVGTVKDGFYLDIATPSVFLVVLHAFMTVYRQVETDERGAAYLFGRALKLLEPGLNPLPWGLVQIKTRPRTTQEEQYPAEPNLVSKKDDREPLEYAEVDGKQVQCVRPIRIVTGAPKSDSEKKGILEKQMTLTVNFVLQYIITDVVKFIAGVGTTKEAGRQLRDICEATAAEEFVQRTAGEVIEKLSDVNHTLRSTLITRTENWGIEILSARMLSPDISHELSKSLRDIPDAEAKALVVGITAEAERNKRVKEGEGAASAREKFLVAEANAEGVLLAKRAEGLTKMKKDLDVDGETVIAALAVDSINEKTNVIIAGAEGGMRDILAAVSGAQAALPKNKPTTKTEE